MKPTQGTKIMIYAITQLLLSFSFEPEGISINSVFGIKELLE